MQTGKPLPSAPTNDICRLWIRPADRAFAGTWFLRVEGVSREAAVDLVNEDEEGYVQVYKYDSSFTVARKAK